MGIKQRNRLRVGDVLTFRRANQKFFQNIDRQNSNLPGGEDYKLQNTDRFVARTLET
jgi:hypothetical protein